MSVIIRSCCSVRLKCRLDLLNSRIVNIISAFAIAALLCVNGCGERKQLEKEDKVIIRYMTFEGLPEQQLLMKQIIMDFEEEHPGIRIKLDYSPDPKKVLVEIAGGNAPDVFYGGDWNAPALVEKKSVINLIPFIEKELDLNDYFLPCVNTFKYGDGLYCFPLHFSTFALAYNKTIFDKANLAYPDETWTWDGYLNAAIKLTKDIDGDGRIDQWGTIRPNFLTWIWANGGKIFNEDGTECLLNSPEVAEAIQFLRDLDMKYRVVPAEWEIREKGTITNFISGRVAMCVIPTFMIVELSKKKDFAWDIVPVPKGKRKASLLSVGGLYISEQSKYKKESWEFVKFYCGKPGLRLLGKSKNCVPAHKEIAYTVFSIPPPEHIKTFIDAVDYAEPMSLKMSEGDEIESQILYPQIDLVFLGKKTPSESLEEVVNRVNKLLKNKRY